MSKVFYSGSTKALTTANANEGDQPTVWPSSGLISQTRQKFKLFHRLVDLPYSKVTAK